MEIGLFLHTHGLFKRDNGIAEWTSVPAEEMRIEEVVRLAERLGFASVWLPDHILTTRVEHDGESQLIGARRMRPPACVMLDSLAVLAYIAAQTETIRIGTSVLVLPHRHPLVVAQQLATIDVLSQGRLTACVGAGWLKSEFDALGLSHDKRFAITDETLEILDLAWRQQWVTYRGRYFDFKDVAVEPKPVQRPRIPVLYGGSTRAAARRALRHCDGIIPRLEQGPRQLEAQLDSLGSTLAFEAARLQRDLASFRLAALASCDIRDQDPSPSPLFLHGPAAKVIDDLATLAGYGFTHCTFRVDVRTGSVDEYVEQVHRLGEEVVPVSNGIPSRPLDTI